jgi:hypothetical protein
MILCYVYIYIYKIIFVNMLCLSLGARLIRYVNGGVSGLPTVPQATP